LHPNARAGQRSERSNPLAPRDALRNKDVFRGDQVLHSVRQFARWRIVNADGSGQHALTLPGYGYWSPDETRVLYVSLD
jgi:hypothetical protein